MKLEEIFREVFELGEDVVFEDLTPENVETWDSLGQLNLVVAIEEEFDISFSFDEVLELDSFNSIKSVLLKKDVEL